MVAPNPFLRFKLFYNNRLELLYGYQKTESGLKVYADMHHVNQNTMTRWIRQFLLHGLAGVRHRSFNHRYSLNTKIEAVKEYQAGFPGEKIIEKYDISSLPTKTVVDPVQ
ncbi:hypothetical protein [Limosilactobacillus allomucosae]|uniref:hypothetical protein n=1 Tax=Limosilactobacillus allomucosae TaxID=3142938 RepID=UPI003266BA75